MPDSFASYDHATASWRTSQLSLLEDLGEWSETWPRAGMTRSGTAYPLPPLAPLTDVTGSGLWPTPRAYSSGEGVSTPGLTTLDIRVRGLYQDRPQGQRYWPTPCTTDAKNVPYQKGKDGKRYPMLLGAVAPERMWPTPKARDFRSPGTPERLQQAQAESSRGQPLTEMVGGQLNPTWVEWLQGYPLEWTALEGWATRSSRKLPNGSPTASTTRKRGG
jgi:hypothetical protein